MKHIIEQVLTQKDARTKEQVEKAALSVNQDTLEWG